jgi:putative DNA primase/helicase
MLFQRKGKKEVHMKRKVGRFRMLGGDGAKVVPSNIPKELKQIDQWVAWKMVEKNGKKSKIPIDPNTGKNASVREPKTWSSFERAFEYFKNHESQMGGIGFVVSKDDQFVGIDLDKCRDPETRKIESWAKNIVKSVNSYTEISPSGRGLRIFAEGTLPEGGRKGENVEIYDQGRYFTVTGRHLKVTPTKITNKPETVRKLYDQLFNAQKAPSRKMMEQDPSNLSDEEIINRAKESANREKFKRLWDGNIDSYPSQSEADLALASLIAYWTKDSEQIDLG